MKKEQKAIIIHPGEVLQEDFLLPLSLKKIAQEERLNYVEVLEDALACYKECGKHRRR